jgi:act minimal PKS chain-length factor (CLF/KS beta)
MAAVVTGIGVTAPNGVGVDEYWAATLAGRSGLAPITRFDPGRYRIQVGGEVTGLGDLRVPGRLAVQTDRWSHLGIIAAGLALADATVSPAFLPEYEMAVVTASSSGGTEFGQKEIEKLWSKGPQHVSAYQSIAWFYAATTGQLSIKHGMRGPCGVICSEQAGGLDSLAQARRLIRQGTRLVLGGGTDASLSPYGLVAQMSTGRLSERGEYRPFDPSASGYLPGEGGAIVVVEDSADALSVPYGVIAGHGATFDVAGREPGLRRAAELALADAGLTPSTVDVVFADAVGLPALDRVEADAIRALFGPHGVPVTAPKTMTGRMYGGGSSLDVVAALLAIRDGVVPPTVGTTTVVPEYELDLVLGEARRIPVRTALILARGWGGFNSALVLTAAD